MYENVHYHESLDLLKEEASALLSNGAGVIFTTNVGKKLNYKYLRLMHEAAVKHGLNPEEVVKHFNCSTCARFMSRVGHLVVDHEGALRSVYWNPHAVIDPLMKDVVAGMKAYVESARIQNVFNVNGPYRNYTEVTNLGGKEFKHYFIEKNVLVHRTPVLNVPIDMSDFSKKFDQVAAVIRFTNEVNLDTVLFVDSLFQARTIEHVGASEKTVKDLRDLISNLQIAKCLPAYETANNPYDRETVLVNKVWMIAMKNTNLLSIRGSILGKLMTFVQDALSKGARDAQIEGIVKFWREQTSGLKYMRTTREASESQISKTARFLDEGGWNNSLKQVEAAEKDIPVHWEAKQCWAFEEGDEPVVNDFAAFAARKGVEVETKSKPKPIDLGYFINEALQYVDSMGVVATGLSFRPIMINRMADMDAKPIFSWDNEESRAPFIPWRYDHNFMIRDLRPEPSITKDGQTVLPVLSITSDKAIGYVGRRAEDTVVFFQFGGISMPDAPRPALFAESMKPEFYEHRRALEDYSRATRIERSATQQSISMAFGPRHPQQTETVNVLVHVRFNEQGQVLFGCRNAIYRFDANGYVIKPDFEKFGVITDRSGFMASAAPATPVATAEMTSI